MVVARPPERKQARASRRPPRRPSDAVHDYARDVLAGRIVAGPLVRLACARHVRDLEEGRARGLHFDPDAADHALAFFGFLRLAEGEFAGRPFVLAPPQAFIVGSLFGWLGPDGYRRFRTAYIEMGKGNGKTPLCAGIGLYGLVADEEPAAQISSRPRSPASRPASCSPTRWPWSAAPRSCGHGST